MASLCCHGDSDCNKTQIIRNFQLYVIQLWKPFFHIVTNGDVMLKLGRYPPPKKIQLSHLKLLISNWPRTREFSKRGSCFWPPFWPFSPRSRGGHALRPIFTFWLVRSWQVCSCGKFMQHLETCLPIAETDRVLCNVVKLLTVFFYWMRKMKYSC